MSIAEIGQNNCLPLILSHLPIRQLGRITTVCKQWNVAASSDGAWVKINIFGCPTPSPIKMNTISVIQGELLRLSTLVNKIPADLLSYSSPVIYSEFTTERRWKACVGCDTDDIDLSQINSIFKFRELLITVANIFEGYLNLHRVGFMGLDRAEAIAVGTKGTFHNPYPFKVLVEKYRELENPTKAAEMQKIADKYSNS